MNLELEAKYLWLEPTPPESAVIGQLRSKSVGVSEPRCRKQTDHYLDTPDRQLLQARWACRWRDCPENETLGLKSFGEVQGAFQSRLEEEQPASSPPKKIGNIHSGPVADRLATLSVDPDARFEKLFQVANKRTVFDITGTKVTAELAIDRVTVTAADRTPVHYIEIEIELKSGSESAFRSLALKLAQTPGLIPAKLSKFERGYYLAFPGKAASAARIKASHLRPKKNFARFVADFLQQQFELATSYEKRAWEGVDPRGVHQMRVATRRLRSALAACKFALPPKATGEARAALKELAKVLGSVRDLDVFLPKLRGHLAQLTEPAAKKLEPLESHVARCRIEAHLNLVAYLSGLEYQNNRCATENLIAQAHDKEYYSDTPITNREAAAKLLPKQLKRVRKLGDSIDPDTASDHQLHELRIEGKRLRYLANLFTSVFGDPLAHLAHEASLLQDLLGEHQDACFELAYMEVFADAEKSTPKLSAALGELAALANGRRITCRVAFSEAWKKFRAESDPKTLKAILC